MYLKEIQLFMSRAYGPGSYDPTYEKQGVDYPIGYVRWTENRNMEEFLRLLAQDRIHVDGLVTHSFPVTDAPKAYETILQPGSGSLAVLLRYEDPEDASFEPRRKVTLPIARVNKSELRAGLIGAGNLARWAHLPNLQKTPGVRLEAVCSSSGARGKSYARRFGAAYCCSDERELLRDPEIDMVVIASRNQHHASQALRALESGKHVFVEKPMAITEEECHLLEQAVDRSGRQLTVGFNRRFAPFYLEQKRCLASRVGPAVLQCRINSPGISGSYWMADPEIGGAILGEACHFVDLMYWLLDSEPVEVSAYSLPVEVKEPVGENNLVASFRFADGSVGNLTYCTVGSRSSAGERVEVFAQGLGAVTEDFKQFTAKHSIARTRKSFFAEKGYNNQLSAFMAAVREGRLPSVT